MASLSILCHVLGSLTFIIYFQELPSELVAMDTDSPPHGQISDDGELSTEQVCAWGTACLFVIRFMVVWFALITYESSHTF